MKAPHREQRIPRVDLAVVREQELADIATTISDHIEVRELPTLGGRPLRTSSTRQVRFDGVEIGVQVGVIGCLFEQEDDGITMHDIVDGLSESLALATERANKLAAELDLVRSTLLADSPMGPSWTLGQVRRLLGLGITDDDAETLDLTGPGVEANELGGES